MEKSNLNTKQSFISGNYFEETTPPKLSKYGVKNNGGISFDLLDVF